jgi:pilus assembly protein CpaB
MALRLGKFKINRLWVLVVSALILGIFATWLSVTYLRNREKAIEIELSDKIKGGPKTAVIVANTDLPVGFVIMEGAVSARDIASDLVYADTLTTDSYDAIVGKPLLRAVQQGRPLMRQDIIDDTPKDFSQMLTKGMRAITMDIDDVNSISQMLRPGNFIDLHLIAPEPGVAQSQEVFLFLQHVKVLATGTATTAAPNAQNTGSAQAETAFRYATITVEVTPEEAAYIALAQQSGRIRATLRPMDDTEIASYLPVTSTRLIGTSTRKVGGVGVASASAVAPHVEYILGGKAGGGAAPPINITVPGLPQSVADTANAMSRGGSGSSQPNVPDIGGPAVSNAVNQANPAAYAPR